MQSVDETTGKSQKKGKKKPAKIEVAPVESEPLDFPEEVAEDSAEEDEIDQLFGSGKINQVQVLSTIRVCWRNLSSSEIIGNNASNFDTSVEENSNGDNKKAKGPEVVVFADTRKKTVTGTSKAQYKAFMVCNLLPKPRYCLHYADVKSLNLVIQSFKNGSSSAAPT